ncbi:MAG: proline--tRNA ligase [Campylobacterales bacterium]
MRFSQLFFKTTKDDPKDSVLASHKFLVRGSYIMQVGSGIYDFLPLGKMVLEKIKKVIKEELDNSGAQEVSLGFVTPASLWEKSGRLDKYGKELLRFKDRKDQEFVLGPTHEEMMVFLASHYINSYKDLPKNLYQINLKFRDEIRPRFGLLRGREFLMKDGYSFHTDEEDMRREFALMEETYKKIFTRLGLDFRVVEADSGAIGGSGSREFMVLAQSGEDDIVVCNSCEYAANTEVAKSRVVEASYETPKGEMGRFHTPNIKSIDEICDFFKIDSYFTLKAVCKKAIFEKEERLAIFFLRGCDTLQEIKAKNSCGADELIDLSDEEISALGLPIGFVGPYENDSIIQIFDNSLRGARWLVAGANEVDYHFVGVNLEDFESSLSFDDIKEVKEGEGCPSCSGTLSITKGIEVGHIFQLNDRYSKPLDATFQDENGKPKHYVMGTYGIGVSRLIAAIIEQHHDEKGAIFTKESAAFDMVIVVSNTKNEEQSNHAETLYASLLEAGVNVAYDDRAERYGAKMTDFELMGFPYAVVVGKKTQEGLVEFVSRKNLEKIELKLEDALEYIKSVVRS